MTKPKVKTYQGNGKTRSNGKNKGKTDEASLELIKETHATLKKFFETQKETEVADGPKRSSIKEDEELLMELQDNYKQQKQKLSNKLIEIKDEEYKLCLVMTSVDIKKTLYTISNLEKDYNNGQKVDILKEIKQAEEDLAKFKNLSNKIHKINVSLKKKLDETNLKLASHQKSYEQMCPGHDTDCNNLCDCILRRFK